MRTHYIQQFALCLALAASAASAGAQTVTFDTTRVPTEFFGPGLESRSGTQVLGLNDAGQFVGVFGERNSTILGVPHSFIYGSTGFGTAPGAGAFPGGYRLGIIPGELYADPEYRYLDLYPSLTATGFNERVSRPNAINNAGIVVGRVSTDFLDRGPFQAFVYNTNSGALSLLAVPGATSSDAVDINDAGQIVGNFTDASGAERGFLFSGGAYTVIDRPGYPNGGTRIGGINDAGTIVGSSYDFSNASSFIYRGGSFEDFTANGLYTVAADINNAEQIVGWVGVSGQRRGFYRDTSQTVILDLSTTGFSTYAYRINNNGLIAGVIGGPGGDDVGFLGTVSAVPEPAAWALWALGLAGLMGLKRRSQPAPLAKASRKRRHPITAPQ